MNPFFRPLLFLLLLSPTLLPAQPSLDRLADFMTGYFDSADQAAEDSSYYPITLAMVRIWPARTDGYWLYIEQAVASSPERPYRQRIYHLYPQGDTLISAVYELPVPEDFINRYEEPAAFTALSPEQLVAREGCEVRVWPEGNAYRGKTGAHSCASELRGASYATSEVVITAEKLSSWDRGFDAAGQQVWGATEGPYVFLKRKNYGL